MQLLTAQAALASIEEAHRAELESAAQEHRDQLAQLAADRDAALAAAAQAAADGEEGAEELSTWMFTKVREPTRLATSPGVPP